MTAPASLRPFFAFLEKNGAVTARAELLDQALGGSERAFGVKIALARARLVRVGPPATTLPCPELAHECARDVRPLPLQGKAKIARLVAVCSRSPRACATIDVTPEELTEIAVSLADLVSLIRRSLGIEATSDAPDAFEGAVHLGEQMRERGGRDVVLLLQPAPKTFAHLVETLDRGSRETLLLVPTPRAVTAGLRAGHGLGAHVEIDTLADLFHVKDGAVAVARRLRLVTNEAPRETAVAPPRATAAPSPPAEDVSEAGSAIVSMLPTAHHWRDVAVTLVDDETITVEIGRRFRRMTFGDLGLDHRGTRRPTRAWELLVLCCRGGGSFSWRAFGTFTNARQVVVRLRQALKTTFGIEEDPFHPYMTGVQWMTRFVAKAHE